MAASAVHLANEKDNERVRLVEVRGMKAASIQEGFKKMQAMADMAGAGEKEFYYHANLNPMEGEELTAEQWEEASKRLRENLSLDSQPGMVIEHVKGGRTHRHHIDLRVDLETGKLISDSWNYAKHEKTARELEREFDLGRVRGALVERDGPRPERRPEKWEVQRGKRSGIDPQAVKEEVTGLWNGTENGAQFRIALAQRGYLLAQGDRRDFCIIDAAGNEHSLARRIQGVRAKDIRERLADIERDVLPKVDTGRTDRREDKRRLTAALDAGADRSRIEAAMNAGRASAVSAREPVEARTERERREAYDDAVLGRKAPAPHRSNEMTQYREPDRTSEFER